MFDLKKKKKINGQQIEDFEIPNPELENGIKNTENHLQNSIR